MPVSYTHLDVYKRQGYGRIDMIENRYVGLKSRECYEVPAGLALIQAHKALEDLCFCLLYTSRCV